MVDLSVSTWTLAFAFLLLSCGTALAAITDCPAGYRFDRMSGVGCVQDKCRDVPHGFYSYVGYCVCSACGDAGCSGDKGFEKECRRPHEDKSCPGCLYLCINPKDKCPGEKDAQTASVPLPPTTIKGQKTTTTIKAEANNTAKVKGRMTAFGKPLKYVRMYCGDGRVEVTTDENGVFEFEAVGGKAGEDYDCEVRFEYVRNGRTYFQVHNQDDTEPATLNHKFKLGGTDGDMAMEKLLAEDSDGGEAQAAVYMHMTEALEFYIDGLKEDLDFQLPLHVHSFMPDDPNAPRAQYNGDNGESNIYIQTRDSVQGSPDRQMEIYHEFSHYVMQALYGKWPYPEGQTDVKERNHGGFMNPSTSDAYVEAFASFMSVAMMEAYGQTVPSGRDDSKLSLSQLIAIYGNGPVSDLETDYKAWDKQGKMEEYAGAGILWDLIDNEKGYREDVNPDQMWKNYLEWKTDMEEANEYTRREYPEEPLIDIPQYTRHDMDTARLDDDQAELDFQKDVWPVLRTYHSDFSDVYNDIVKRRPDQKTAIDDVFVKHGFFADDMRGNGQYDDFEPFDDANKNGERDDGGEVRGPVGRDAAVPPRHGNRLRIQLPAAAEAHAPGGPRAVRQGRQRRPVLHGRGHIPREAAADPRLQDPQHGRDDIPKGPPGRLQRHHGDTRRRGEDRTPARLPERGLQQGIPAIGKEGILHGARLQGHRQDTAAAAYP
ncbi:MAG: hypothetical protein V1875_02495 [Candidatus Altiarchaeota archaeon]